jgi:uncharacterized protein YecT (DUF1311 family)
MHLTREAHMEQAIYLLLGAALTWIWHLVQRQLERRGTSEAIERGAKLLALKQGLEGANTSLEDLRRFEGRLIGKAETAVRIADVYVGQAEDLARHGAVTLADHDDMNRQAIAAFVAMDARLRALVAHLRRQLDGDSLDAFDDAHAAWREFRERHASFVARSYSGGSIRPLIHAVTLESVTAAWITELETQLGDDEAEWARAQPSPRIAEARRS